MTLDSRLSTSPEWSWGVAGGSALGAREHASPPPGPREITVRVHGCAVSSRDLCAIAGAAPYGRAPGGAVTGQVVAEGSEATGWIGAHVIVPPWLPCFECDVCRRARGVVCPRGEELGIDRDGGFAPEITVPARPVLPFRGALALPAGLSEPWRLAALAREGALAYATYARLGVGPGDAVVVIGMTAIGRLLIDILRSKGASAIAVDWDPAALEAVHGKVKHVASPHDAGALAGELGATARVVDTTGGAQALEAAMALLPPAGTLVLVGHALEAARLSVDVRALAARDQSIVGIAGCHADLLPELAALALRGDLDLEAITAPVPRGDVSALVDRMRAGKSPALCPVLIPM